MTPTAAQPPTGEETDAGLSRAVVEAHAHRLGFPWRTVRWFAGQGLVEGPSWRSRGPRLPREVWYPAALPAQLDAVKAAHRVTHDPKQLRQMIWWGGGPAGAAAAARSALYRRVRADWVAALRPIRAGAAQLAALEEEEAASRVEDLLAGLGQRRGLRAQGLYLPRDCLARQSFGWFLLGALTGRQDWLEQEARDRMDAGALPKPLEPPARADFWAWVTAALPVVLPRVIANTEHIGALAEAGAEFGRGGWRECLAGCFPTVPEPETAPPRLGALAAVGRHPAVTGLAVMAVLLIAPLPEEAAPTR
ncbi:MAG: hypothetical protein ACRDZX_03695 [Acidimicrobiales bacterium]